jgi:hypothetical protein
MSERGSEIVQLRIELSDTDPLVWRRVQVPARLRLRRLHDVIQAVFDWWACHLHQFEIGGGLYGATEYDAAGPGEGRLYSDRNVSLRQLIDRGCTGFLYRYDFGDDWEHVVMVEKTGPAEPGVAYPVLVDGAPGPAGGHRRAARLRSVSRSDGRPEPSPARRASGMVRP